MRALRVVCQWLPTAFLLCIQLQTFYFFMLFQNTPIAQTNTCLRSTEINGIEIFFLFKLQKKNKIIERLHKQCNV